MAPLRTSCLAGLLPLFAASSVDPSNSAFQYVGRWSFENPSAPAFQWAGSSISFKLTCPNTAAGVSASFDTHEKYTKFGIYLGDGLSTVGPPSHQLLAAGTGDVKMSLASGENIVTIVKTTEDLKPDPAQGSSSMLMKPAVFLGLTIADDGACTISPAPRKERRMQFIGDSITCGFGNQANSLGDLAECELAASHTTVDNVIQKILYDLEDTHGSWSMALARKFGADAHVQCMSGVGMCRNGIGLSPSNPYNMTYFIDRTLPFTTPNPSNMWDYSRYQPDVVVVNLGTNDYIAATGPLAPTYESFQAHYVAFVTRLMSNYQASKTKVLLVCGPMTSRQCPYVEAAATELSKSFHAAYIRVDVGSLGGCAGHPTQADGTKMVDVIAPALEKLTGWSGEAMVV